MLTDAARANLTGVPLAASVERTPGTIILREESIQASEEQHMREDVVMPQMGESVAEGTVTVWLKEIGDFVERDEPL